MKNDPLFTRIKSSSYDPEYATYEYTQGSKDRDMPLFYVYMHKYVDFIKSRL